MTGPQAPSGFYKDYSYYLYCKIWFQECFIRGTLRGYVKLVGVCARASLRICTRVLTCERGRAGT